MNIIRCDDTIVQDSGGVLAGEGNRLPDTRTICGKARNGLPGLIDPKRCEMTAVIEPENSRLAGIHELQRCGLIKSTQLNAIARVETDNNRFRPPTIILSSSLCPMELPRFQLIKSCFSFGSDNGPPIRFLSDNWP